jgi:hypothetical protein
MKRVEPLAAYFSEIEAPRSTINRKYPLNEVVVITILAAMSSARGWEDIETYGEARKQWLSRYLKLEHGIPGHDVYRRVFYVLKPKLIEDCFMNWVGDIKSGVKGEVIAIDGCVVTLDAMGASMG